MPEKRAAIGIQMHSGWGVLVAVASGDSVEILNRRRIVVVDAAMNGANQPYHHARQQLDKLNLDEAEHYLAKCTSTSQQLAVAEVEAAVLGLRDRGYRLKGAAILRSAGRTLPNLPQILASHPLIHTAEGEFFCNAVTTACEHLHIPVTNIRRRDLEEQARTTLGRSAIRVQRTIASLGKSIGPPWTADHKNAALAAVTILARA